MNDFLLVIYSVTLCVGVAAVWRAFAYWFEHRKECDHEWSNWSDPVKAPDHQYQLRACKKCNAYQSRTIQ
jgi:hypothetical protein